ncbi:MAG TPA: sigma-70 family RNA polymerase sigma factor [Gemmataceae bacterium]|nr:sigma-70 family RNA polymerase sigma factor [Gemmataceae bacterium]
MVDASSSSDTRPSLLLRIRDPRDAAAWQTFVDVYAPLVYAHCRRKGLQEADASDVTQEVLTEVAHSIAGFRYDPQRGRFRDWLGTLTRYRLAHFFGGRRPAAQGDERLEQVPAPEADAEWTAEFHTRLLQVALERARPHFEATTWRAFELAWLEGRPAADVADAVGLPIEKVYVAKSRALKALREIILELAEDLPLPGLGE